MGINATNKAVQRELIEPGNYTARCVSMIHIGKVKDTFEGKEKLVDKVRIGWELPEELIEFEENGQKKSRPRMISKEYNLSLNPKAGLRKMLASWRGKDFTKEQAESFDITALIGVPCLLNIIHKESKDGSAVYEEISSVSTIPKSMKPPKQITPTFLFDYEENFDVQKVEALPDFIKNKIKESEQWRELTNPHESEIKDRTHEDLNAGADNDDLPF